eukprot:CAMPEP_0117420410 /NCGR_PEP_ID=MMETSP0758-20121206/1744_1 /TAXON_ID=63605 /ORGANISM="Percolomonas cosmopolitus, Strain AE-1 (ATCC 50343)" /LENGTH=189 /DNA_ID=CAMNT_0005201991 /DNA_START=662 /DNA_END=1232 /DNA_ORIENTATION=-
MEYNSEDEEEIPSEVDVKEINVVGEQLHDVPLYPPEDAEEKHVTEDVKDQFIPPPHQLSAIAIEPDAISIGLSSQVSSPVGEDSPQISDLTLPQDDDETVSSASGTNPIENISEIFEEEEGISVLTAIKSLFLNPIYVFGMIGCISYTGVLEPFNFLPLNILSLFNMSNYIYQIPSLDYFLSQLGYLDL